MSYKVSVTVSPDFAKQISSVIRLLTCRTSSTPRLRRKPCCSSSMNFSENFCSRSATRRAMILTPTLSNVTPRQFPLLLLGCFFFQSGMTIAVSHSCGQRSASACSDAVRVCCQMSWTRATTCVCKLAGAHFNISTVTPVCTWCFSCLHFRDGSFDFRFRRCLVSGAGSAGSA